MNGAPNATAISRLRRLTTHLRPHHIRSAVIDTMSSPPPAAPWRSLFISHLTSMDSPEFTLGTLRRASAAGPRDRRSSILATPVYLPRARTCICRGLWTHLPVNPKNDAPLNPSAVWESDLLTFTTDARMDKMEELVSLNFRGGFSSAFSGRVSRKTSKRNACGAIIDLKRRSGKTGSI